MEEQIENLKIMQSNILLLFQGVIKERNEYKDANNFLTASLKQMIERIDLLERQNDMLQKCNISLRSIFGVGVKTLKKLDLSCSNSIKDNKFSLELLQKLFLESCEKIELRRDLTIQAQISPGGNEKNPEIKTEGFEDETENKNSSFHISKSPTLVRDEKEDQGNERGMQEELKNREEILRNIVGEKRPDGFDGKITLTTSAFSSEQLDMELCNPSELPPRINGTVNVSPVFKDCRRLDAARAEDDKILKPSALKLINEKFVEKSVQMLISPPKPQQTHWSSGTNKGHFTPKRGNNDSKSSRSPGTPLRNPSSKEADTISGGKKLTQTILNIDCFKQSPAREKFIENGDDDRISKKTKMVNADDDDIICDSPKTAMQLLENIKQEEESEKDSRYLDETFISSPIVRKFNSGQNNMVEQLMKYQATSKRSREVSPEYDSVPFIYKRKAVRKKEERMKLPGHPCDECDKYYKNALGEIDPKDLEKIINKCSRHRDKNPPSFEDTPPGYWKPYLTCSTIFSTSKDNSR